MPIKSKDKGARGELEVAALLQSHGFNARRGQQFAGGGDSPDVMGGPAGFHLEVKYTESFQLWNALDQAARDAKAGEVPLVLHRKNRKDWVVVIYARDFFPLLGGPK